MGLCTHKGRFIYIYCVAVYVHLKIYIYFFFLWSRESQVQRSAAGTKQRKTHDDR